MQRLQCGAVNVVNVLTNIHKRHPIACPLGQHKGCLCGFSIWLIVCLSSYNYLCYILQNWTTLLWHSTVFKIYILFPYCNALETELIFPLTAFPLSKFLFAMSTLGWILVVMGELANGTGSCKSISGSHLLHTLWKMIWLILCWWFSFLFLHLVKCRVGQYR